MKIKLTSEENPAGWVIVNRNHFFKRNIQTEMDRVSGYGTLNVKRLIMRNNFLIVVFDHDFEYHKGGYRRKT